MNSFEINKIITAILVTILVVFGIGKISNIIFAVDEEVRMLNCKKNSKKGCNNKSTKCITHNLWDELDQHIHQFFEKVKLQDLVRQDFN